jgi:acylphosphatase
MNDAIVEFEGWEKVLKDTVPVTLQAGYREAVVKFRHWLRETGKKATVEVFKEHLAWKKSYLGPDRYELRRQALRWYYDKGRKVSAGQSSLSIGSKTSRLEAVADSAKKRTEEGRPADFRAWGRRTWGDRSGNASWWLAYGNCIWRGRPSKHIGIGPGDWSAFVSRNRLRI